MHPVPPNGAQNLLLSAIVQLLARTTDVHAVRRRLVGSGPPPLEFRAAPMLVPPA